MLTIDLNDLQKGVLEREESVATPDAVWADVPGEFRGPVRVRVRAEAIGDGHVHVTGTLTGTLALACRRCLREVEEPFAVSLDILYRPREVGPDTNGGEAEGVEAVFSLPPETGTVNLVPALREELLLAVPPYPLCDPECSGLCPKCGVVRDEEACDCVLREPDPRWDVLRELETG